MVGILVTGHGHFATGMGSGLALITGITENVAFVDFEEGHTTETLTENLNKAIDELKNCEGILVLSDLPGGAPFKCAVECKFARTELKIEVITGSNLPMLVEGGMMMAAYDDPAQMSESLILTGKDYIVGFGQEKEEDSGEDDDI